MRSLHFILLLGLCIIYFTLLPNHMTSLLSKTSIFDKRSQEATIKSYLVIPRNGSDPNCLKRLNAMILSTANQSDVRSRTRSGVLSWYKVRLTKSQVTTLKKSTDVKNIVLNISSKKQAVLPDRYQDGHSHLRNSTSDESYFYLGKRAQQYESQPSSLIPFDAPRELIAISTPPGEDWQCRDGKYTYPAEAGSGIYIYHIEDGIESGHEKEFEDRVEPALRTEACFQNEGDIDNPVDTLHSTCVADKVVGKNYGSAKKAKIVPVIHESNISDFIESLDLIINNIKEDKEKKLPLRYKSSLVFFSVGFDPEDLVEADIDPNESPFPEMKSLMEEVFDLGIPIVMAAGNRRGKDGISLELDIYPQVWESDDFPAINIGNAYADGQIYESSLRGPQVAVYLDGAGVNCVGIDRPVYGTSLSAPLGAGGIGVYMSQKEGLFYQETHRAAGTRKYVVAVRKFIKTQGSWLSPKGARMFWNQAS